MQCSSFKGAQAKGKHAIRPKKVVVTRSLYRSQAQTTRTGGLAELEQTMQITSPKAWKIIKNELRSKNVALIDVETLNTAKEKGFPIIDIRPKEEYNKGYIEGSVNVQLFQQIEGWTAYKIARRALFAFFGIFNGTEPNEEFQAEVREALGDARRAVLVCNIGGEIEQQQKMIKEGRQSRSLTAAYEILKCVRDDVSLMVLRGGINDYQKDNDLVVDA